MITGVLSQEVVYQHLYKEQWVALFGVMHQHPEVVATDPLIHQAIEVALQTFFRYLDTDPLILPSDALEKLVLLHRGNFYHLPDARFAEVVVALVNRHAQAPDIAVTYARFYPEHPRCADVLRAHAPPPAERVDHAQAEHVTVTATPGQTGINHTISLFRSKQERTFFMAVRDVFPAYLVYPNVALNSLVDYEAIKPHLSGAERSYFFRALVDCVVFDQHDDYRPRFFFELDSPLHDDFHQQVKDAYKAHILALAGQTLHRVRSHEHTPDRTTFIGLLKEIAQQEVSSFGKG